MINFKITPKVDAKDYIGQRYPIDIDDVEIGDLNAELEYESGSIRVVYGGDMYLNTEDSRYVRTNEEGNLSVIIAQGKLSR